MKRGGESCGHLGEGHSKAREQPVQSIVIKIPASQCCEDSVASQMKKSKSWLTVSRQSGLLLLPILFPGFASVPAVGLGIRSVLGRQHLVLVVPRA